MEFLNRSQFVLLWTTTYNCPRRQMKNMRNIKLWEILSNNIYSIFDKNKRKTVNRMLLRYSWKLFIKVVAVRHSKWKVFQKQTFHLTSTIYLLLRCFTLFLLLFFQISFLSVLVFSSFLCFVFRLITEAATGGVL